MIIPMLGGICSTYANIRVSESVGWNRRWPLHGS